MLEGRILICKAKSILHPHSGWFHVSRASRAQQAKALEQNAWLRICKQPLIRNFNNGAGYGGGDFGIDLVSGDLEQWFVDLDGVAYGLEPLRDGAFGYGFAQLGHLNGVRHEL